MKNKTPAWNRLVVAELYKLKSTPVPYLIIAAVILITLILYSGHSMDVHALSRLGANPWERYFLRAMAIFSLFIICPFSVLLVSAVLYSEQRANAWKYLYALPISRGAVYWSKLLVIIALLLASILLMVGALVGSAHLLNYFYPEYEFAYYTSDISTLLQAALTTLVATLGLIGLQYFLCIRYKHFLLPLAIGNLGFILGFMLAAISPKIAYYFPYAYPMIVKDYGMMNAQDTDLLGNHWWNSVELYSIAFFVVFIVSGYFLERKRNIE